MNSDTKKKILFKYICFILVIAVLVLADQFTKILAVDYLKNKSVVSIIKDVLLLRYLENPGAAWGILGGKTSIFTIFTFAVLILMTVLLIRIECVNSRLENRRAAFLFQIFLIILSAGAIGNLIDRIRLGYVIDFIYFKVIDFPTFNVADCYVTVSTAIILILLLFKISENDWNTILTRKEK